ncbi:hypothetical protein FDECE_9271 [Fusarium decemcellulare]|nr:hypothetical protein FDECE_9271 [Fusarium decemcellulare]
MAQSDHLSIPETEDRLCAKCESIRMDQMRSPEGYPYQPTFLALKRSAEAGCRLCGFFCISLEQGVDVDRSLDLTLLCDQYPGYPLLLRAREVALDRIILFFNEEYVSRSEDGLPVHHDLPPGWDQGLENPLGYLDIFAHPGDAPSLETPISGRPLPSTAGDSAQDFETVKRWLAECTGTHSLCPKHHVDAPLPKRVIDVGPMDSSQEPRLILTDSKQFHGHLYATLSHCWGGTLPLSTKSDTLQHRMEGISMASLPKTFREAVIIVRELGLQFLWIDSLCIIQDSAKDWEEQSALMGDIYRGGYINIAAKAAATSAVGCFIPRELEPEPCRVPFGTPTEFMYVRSPWYKVENIENTPLDTRGWVLQERILSPRIIHYGAQQLYWECISSTQRQDGKYFNDFINFEEEVGLVPVGNFKQTLGLYSPTDPLLYEEYQGELSGVMDDSAIERCLHMDQWYHTVMDYTRRNLTYQSDKLAAVAGVAKAFKQERGYRYLAGLWEEDLVRGIMWWISDEKSSQIITDELPSWSWARHSGEIAFLVSPGRETLAKVTDISYEQMGKFGQVTGAKLRLGGPMVKAKYRHSEAKANLVREDGTAIGYARFDVPVSRPADGDELVCCVLSRYVEGWAFALVLHKSDGQTEAYKRIGPHIRSRKGA